MADNELLQVEPIKTVDELVEQNRTTLLQSEDVQELGKVVATQEIKTGLAGKAQQIRSAQIDNAEHEFDNDLRELRLKHAKAEETRKHNYAMQQITVNARHTAMLDKRKKLEEKYGYLYERDEDGNLVDFSYSTVVNALRTLARNFEKLDKPIKLLLKIVFWTGIGVLAIFLLKKFDVLNWLQNIGA